MTGWRRLLGWVQDLAMTTVLVAFRSFVLVFLATIVWMTYELVKEAR